MPARSSNPSEQPAHGTPEDRYETLIEQLEELVERIESGEVGLEESIEAYEKGIRLVGRARAILARAEQRISTLDLETARKQPLADESS